MNKQDDSDTAPFLMRVIYEFIGELMQPSVLGKAKRKAKLNVTRVRS